MWIIGFVLFAVGIILVIAASVNKKKHKRCSAEYVMWHYRCVSEERSGVLQEVHVDMDDYLSGELQKRRSEIF